MEYLLTLGNVDDFNIEMNAIKGHLRNVFFHLTILQRLQNSSLPKILVSMRAGKSLQSFQYENCLLKKSNFFERS